MPTPTSRTTVGRNRPSSRETGITGDAAADVGRDARRHLPQNAPTVCAYKHHRIKLFTHT